MWSTLLCTSQRQNGYWIAKSEIKCFRQAVDWSELGYAQGCDKVFQDFQLLRWLTWGFLICQKSGSGFQVTSLKLLLGVGWDLSGTSHSESTLEPQRTIATRGVGLQGP